MDYVISNRGLADGKAVLTLWRAYRDAGYTTAQMGVHATNGFEPADLADYAHTDLMPFRIAGKLYAVSEYAASTVATSAQYMLQLEQETAVNARDLCIEALDYILNWLHNRQTLTIVCRLPKLLLMRISVSESEFRDADLVAVLVSLGALGLNQFGGEQLVAEKVRLRAS